MKRSELVVGAEVAYHRGDNTYGEKPQKAIILATEPWEKSYSFKREPRLTSKGQGVKVRVFSAWNDNDTGFETVVQLRQLHGDYATEFALYELREAENTARAKERNRLLAEKKKFEQEVLIPELKKLKVALAGIKGDDPAIFRGNTVLQELDVEIIIAITNALNTHKTVNSVSKEWT
jgi:hypothetical protein